MKAWELRFLLSNNAPMIDIHKDVVIGMKMAATEIEVIVVVIEINGALENTEMIIAAVNMVYDRVEGIIS